MKTEQPVERRGKLRFAIERDVRYKLLDSEETVSSGVGRTIDISSGGVLFLGEKTLRVGALIELSVSWPVLLNEDTPVRMIAFGRVVRNMGFVTACTIDKYEFRTQARVKNPIPIRHDTKLLRWAEAMRAKPLERRASA
jgi:hypothetical protein